MLNVNTLPNRKDRILKTFEGPRQLRWRRKRTEEGRINFQNKCVSSQNRRYKKRRGRHRSGFTYLLSAGRFVGPAAFFHGRIQTIGNLPLTT
jgi:hypothetical protein